ncbi:MAG: aspartate aminotransferase family protein [Ignavibacteriae bacterium]|nr:aspartate aminotransferase family protein [Ignavibacteriota bacterium]
MDDSFRAHLARILDAHVEWRSRWEHAENDESLRVDDARVADALEDFFARMHDNYPFFHPMYAGQMLKPPHPVALLGYFAAQLVNPNNHALDGGPATGAMEKEVVRDLASLFGYCEHLGHLTSSGTIANLEALWVARSLHPDRAIAFSENAHYTHARMCEVLGVRTVTIPADARGRMDADALQRISLSENIGTVVATIGTTGLGALDPLADILSLGRARGFRVHADAAYGGFFRLLADGSAPGVDASVYTALHECDSIVVDPHKHGLQPYGCGAVLFRDPSVGRFYKHDSPYTYFTSTELHLGEISLECSRPGAAAAALWLTLRCLPLRSAEGLGPVLRHCRGAALAWADLIRTSAVLYLVTEPDLDIVTFFPATDEHTASAVSAASERVFRDGMDAVHRPVYLSLLRVRTDLLRTRYPHLIADREWTTVLRSVLMKPEHARIVEELHRRVEKLCTSDRG